MEDFVPYELAVKLNEAGFNYYTKEIYEINVLLERYFEIPKPTISQVLKWLREEKLILIGLSPMQEYDVEETIEWCAVVYKADKQGGLSFEEEVYYESYEQAAITGISYVLDNLI